MPQGIANVYNFSADLSSANSYKNQLALVYAPDRVTFIDVLRDAPLLAGFTETLNSAVSPMRVTLPRRFDNYDQTGEVGSRGTIAQGNMVVYYLFGPNFLHFPGAVRYIGQIDTIEPEVADNGAETVTITLVPYSSIFGDKGIASNIIFGTFGTTSTYIDPLDMMKYFSIFADPFTIPASYLSYIDPFYWDSNNPTSSGVKCYYAFSNQTLGSIYDTCLLMLPANWYYRPSFQTLVNGTSITSYTLQVNHINVLPDHILYVGKNISNPQYRIDWSQLRNVVVYKGGNNGGSVTGQVTTSPTVQVLAVPMQVSVQGNNLALGIRMSFFTEARIIDLGTLYTIAYGMLAQLNRYTIRTKVRIPDVGGQAGMGYFIDSIQVGDSIQIVDPTAAQSQLSTQWDVGVWDVDFWDFHIAINLETSLFNHTLPVVTLAYGFDYIDVELDSLMPNLSAAFKSVQQSLQDFTAGIAVTGAATASTIN